MTDDKEFETHHGSGSLDGGYVVRIGDEISFLDRNGNEDDEALTKILTNFNGLLGIDQLPCFQYPYLFEKSKIDWHEDLLKRLAAQMKDSGAMQGGNVPAGYTYLGQFIIHDMSWFNANVTKLAAGQPYSKTTAALDLDSVFGLGIDGFKAFSAVTSDEYAQCPLSVGYTYPDHVKKPEDLPRRNGKGRPIWRPQIPDERNDDFLPLAQIHLLFIKFYNYVYRLRVKKCDSQSEAENDDAIKCCIQHYHSIILHDYLTRIIDEDVYNDVMEHGRAVISPDCSAGKFCIPIELALAIARFGHAMIREAYPDWNKKESESIANEGSIDKFIHHSFKNRTTDRPMAKLPDDWTTDWSNLFELSGKKTPLMAREISASVIEKLTRLEPHIATRKPGSDWPGGDEINLAELTLRRQATFKLNSAEASIEMMNKALKQRNRSQVPVLSASELSSGESNAIKKLFERELPHGFKGTTPLWYYVLKEAELHANNGKCGILGKFASRVVMESMHAAIQCSGFSGSKPGTVDAAYDCITPDRHFTMADLINCVQQD